MRNVVDSTLADAKTAGCDTVQLKYDGLACQYVVANGKLKTLDMTGYAVDDPVEVDPTINCTLIGTYVFTKKLRWVFDCWCVQETNGPIDLRAEPYRSRYVAARIQCAVLGDVVKLVTNHSISKAPNLWATLPLSRGVKGLIFRNSHDNVSVPLRVARWYLEAPSELL